MSVASSFLIAPALAAAISPAGESWRFHADFVLGTRCDLAVTGGDVAGAERGTQAALAEIDRLSGVFDWRRPESQLGRLNASREMPVSHDLFEVLERAAFWRRTSASAFDERLGGAYRLWRQGQEAEALDAAQLARASSIDLDRHSHTASRQPGAIIDLDAIAKGYIIDRALVAARLAAPDATALLVAIGGDMAAWRSDPTSGAWRIGLPDPDVPADNAPLSAIVDLSQGALASSGRGGRDVMYGARRIGPALGASNGPETPGVAATVQAASAMDADALATIALVMPARQAIAIAQAAGASLRTVSADGVRTASPDWKERPAPQERFLHRVQLAKPAPPPAAAKWPVDWRLALWYALPERRDRTADFREPYMAVWISDQRGNPVRTLFMVGRNPDWQRDNFIWWSKYRARAGDIIDARSEATAPTGRYAFMWEGKDDNDARVPSGKYVIHVETNRERGAHTHRTMEIEIGAEKFRRTMPDLPLEGGFRAVWGHFNDTLEP